MRTRATLEIYFKGMITGFPCPYLPFKSNYITHYSILLLYFLYIYILLKQCQMIYYTGVRVAQTTYITQTCEPVCLSIGQAPCHDLCKVLVRYYCQFVVEDYRHWWWCQEPCIGPTLAAGRVGWSERHIIETRHLGYREKESSFEI